MSDICCIGRCGICRLFLLSLSLWLGRNDDRVYCTNSINSSGGVTCDQPDEILVSSNYHIRKE